MAKSIGIHFLGFEDIFGCYRENENLKIHFGRMDTLRNKHSVFVPITAIFILERNLIGADFDHVLGNHF